ncbi:MAG: hypothetical protein A2X84_13930 [Desulfuromonadaceae bacterium GWC2_58_13]|nr:MAG: hypothetical protein A2X84_13930 [Desulfuromonadaceae bacterium GWC2_58_13]
MKKISADPREKTQRPSLQALVIAHEQWLMERALFYAQRQNYTLYTSTLLEAWRASIVGLSDALVQALATSTAPLELHPDEDLLHDPVTAYGILQAKNHRTRGITIGMFLGLMKYYRQSYQDLVAEKVKRVETRKTYRLFIDRFFDRIELGFCGEWASHNEVEKVEELQSTNRRMTNEKNLYLTIFESLFSPVLLLNATGHVINLNHRAKQLFSSVSIPGSGYYSPVEAVKLSWMDELLTAASAGDDPRPELELPTSAGCHRFEVEMKKMLDVSGKFTGTVVILRDVTDLRKAEQQQKLLFDELQRSNGELESFAHIASHDLQEPLRMVTSYLQLLERRYYEVFDESGKEFMEFALDGAQRMRTLIDDLLNYSKIGRKGQDRVDVDLQEVMAQVLRSLQPAIAESSAQLNIAPLPALKADRVQMLQLFQNLLSNAIKFHGEGSPRITVGVENQPTCWAFFVQDNGIGIDPRHFERIFQIFQRVHGKRDFPGTGIGLALCRKIVENHGGEIRVASTPGVGTTFHFTLRKDL